MAAIVALGEEQASVALEIGYFKVLLERTNSAETRSQLADLIESMRNLYWKLDIKIDRERNEQKNSRAA